MLDVDAVLAMVMVVALVAVLKHAPAGRAARLRLVGGGGRQVWAVKNGAVPCARTLWWRGEEAGRPAAWAALCIAAWAGSKQQMKVSLRACAVFKSPISACIPPPSTLGC